jgi:hypothetical protein
LRLADCERLQGDSKTALALLDVLFSAPDDEIKATELARAYMISARTQLEMGDIDAAREQLSQAALVAQSSQDPLAKISLLSALAIEADLDQDAARAFELHRSRLQLAEKEYAVPAYLSVAHLDLANSAARVGEHEVVREHAARARAYAEELGNSELLLQAFRFLITSYYRANDIDAAVQLARSAAPMLPGVRANETKAFFLQIAALALNLRGHFEESRAFTAALRDVALLSDNPLYGAMADLVVFHRLYLQQDFESGWQLARSLRAKVEANPTQHAALPQALAYEALAASRGAPIEEAKERVVVLQAKFADAQYVAPAMHRAIGHIKAREGDVDGALASLQRAEAAEREIGVITAADYILMEIAELQLDAGLASEAWDALNRVEAALGFDYQLARLQARAYALEGRDAAALAALKEAQLRSNDLWTSEDQLQLESYQLAVARSDH